MASGTAGPIRPPLRPPDDPTVASEGGSRKGDFISDYADYADILEAPREVHEVVAISLLAAALNPHVSIHYGGLRLTLDLWTLILSGSGLGRNTLVSLASPVLEPGALGSLVRGNTWGSGPAFYDDLARNPKGLFIWPEFSLVLRTLNQPLFSGVKEWLTDRFDNTTIPPEVRYRKVRRSSSTPPITFSEAPRLNILATSSVDWFVSSLAREDTTGGFVPRWFLVRVPDTKRVISKPNMPNPELITPLTDQLVMATKLAGVADLSHVEGEYDAWYHEARRRFEMQPNRTLAAPFFNRLRSLVLKLAVISEVSASGSLRVSSAAMKRAIAWAASTEGTIFELIPTGMTAEGFAIGKIEQAVRLAGVPGITRSDLTRAFQGERNRDREERLTTLVTAGRVCIFQRTTGGRMANVYVWSEFRESHEKDFPTDKLFVAPR